MHLTHLGLLNCTLEPGANQQIFGARTCSIVVSSTAPVEAFSQPGDFARLDSCCPELQQLQITYMSEAPRSRDLMQLGAPSLELAGFNALRQLSSLTQLDLSTWCLCQGDTTIIYPPEFISSVATLTQLRSSNCAQRTLCTDGGRT